MPIHKPLLKRISLAWVLALFLLASQGTASAFSLNSGSAKISLLEVYSSEGCSSCPAADRWVGGLKGHPDLWKEFVPVVFHVDYWDYLGWKDRMASPVFTQRQKAYAYLWRRNSLYTPGFVIDGLEWRGWDRFTRPPHVSENEVGRLSVRSDDNRRYDIEFRPRASEKTQWNVHAALLGLGIQSEIEAGENAGRSVEHNFVVLNYVQKKMTDLDDVQISNVELEPPQTDKVKKWAVAFWVTRGQDPRPVQSVGGYLE